MEDYPVLSYPDSNDMLWEAFQADIDVNRANQEGRLQPLKGKVLRVSPDKHRTRKSGKRRKRMFQKLLMRKAFSRALDTIRLLACKVKLDRKRKRCPQDYGNNLSMKFNVCSLSPKHDQGSNIPEASDDPNVFNEELHARDQIVQTGEVIMVDKLCQTDFGENSHTKDIRNASEVIKPHVPVYLPPLPCNLCVYGMTGSHCCTIHTRHVCSCGSAQEARHCQVPVRSPVDEGVQTDDSAVRQFSLQQICDQLLVQLREKINEPFNEGHSSDIVPSETCGDRVESPNQTSEAVCQQSKKLIEAINDLQTDRVVLSANQMAVASRTAVQNVFHLSQALKTMPPNAGTSSNKMLETKTNSPEPLTPSVTPDLLRDNYNDHSQNVNISSIDCSIDIFGEQSMAKINVSPHKMVMMEGHYSQILKYNKPESTTGLTRQVDSLIIISPQAKRSVTDIVAVAKNVENGSKSCTTESNDNVEDLRGRVAKTLFFDPSGSKQSIGDATSKAASVINSEKSLGRYYDTLKPVERTVYRSSESTNKTSHGEFAVKQCTKAAPNKKEEEAVAQELKVLTRDHHPDVTNVTRKQAVSSPAFEEMDSSDMENVLLVWRQQELLHQNDEETEKVSPSSLFKKVKRPLELPAELSRCKIVQPPCSLEPSKKTSKASTSALQILDAEVKSCVIDDEDDVPENSPKPVILPSKKRKLKLRLHPPIALPVIFEKSKDSAAEETLSDASTVLIDQNVSKPVSAKSKSQADGEEGNVNVRDDLDSHDDLCLALRLKMAKAEKKSAFTEEKTNPGKSEEKGLARRARDKKETVKSKSCSKNDELNNNSTTSSTLGSAKNQISKDHCNSKANFQEVVKSAGKTSEKETQYEDQIKQRNDKLKKQWLLEKSADEDDDVFVKPSPRVSRSHAQFIDCDQDALASLDKMPELKDCSAVEVGKAHDLVVNIILNPWRGIVVKPVTRGFMCPSYDTKSVSRALWDLRSNAIPENVVESVLSLGWKDTHQHALRAMLSLFTLSLTRDIPFVIETHTNDDEDIASICSDVELKKKPTPVRMMATKQIFKGECIEGLYGLLMKVPMKDKDKLKSWSLSKFGKQGDWAIFGPLAYMKRRESLANTMAVCFHGEIIAVKALRQILVGERLLLSLKDLELSL